MPVPHQGDQGSGYIYITSAQYAAFEPFLTAQQKTKFESSKQGTGGYIVDKDWWNGLVKQYKDAQDSGNGNPNMPDIGGLLSGLGGSGTNPADMRAEFIEALRSWGLAPNDGNLNNLIENGVNGKWSVTRFMQSVRKTPVYNQNFRGIQWRTGMTENAYIQLYGQYAELAKNLGAIGKGFSRETFATLLKNNTTASEWAVRTDAVDKIASNAQILANYEEVLKSRGMLKPGANLTKKEAYKIITKQADPRFEAVWNEAYAAYQLQSSGINVSGKAGHKELRNMLAGFETRTPEGSTPDYGQLAQLVSTVMPLSRIGQYGLSKHDLLSYALGTPEQQAHVAERIDQIVKNEDAFRGFTPKGVQTSPTGPQAQGGMRSAERAQY